MVKSKNRGALSVLLLLWVASFSHANTAVLEASEGVLRIWAGVPIQAPPAQLQAQIQQQGFVTDGRSVLFGHQGQYYGLKGSGSSFAVTPSVLGTNHHVVEDVITGKAKGFLVQRKAGKLALTPLTILWHDANRDLALVSGGNLRLSPLTFSHPDSIYKTANVWSIGFPGASDEVLGGLHDFTGYFEPKIRDGNLSSPRDKGGVPVWEHNADISAGNSGGPLVNACGEVVGVNTFVHRDNGAVLFAVSGKELYLAMTDLNLKYDTARMKCFSTPNWLIPVAAVAALLLVAVLLFLFSLKRQIAQGRYQPSRSQLINNIARKMGSHEIKPVGEGDWQRHDDGRLYRLDPVHGIIWKDEQASEQSSDQPPVPPPAPTPAPSPSPVPGPVAGIGVNVLVDGQPIAQQTLHSGQRLTVGRDSTNHLVVPEDFISSRHLELEKITDTHVRLYNLSKTNGTYVNGQKATAPVTVSANDRITLANDRVVLTLNGSSAVATPARASAVLQPLNAGLPTMTLIEGELVSVGRGAANQIVLTGDTVSTQHCLLRLNPGGILVVEDQASTNGTYVDDTSQSITKAHIGIGQTLYLANTSFGFKRVQ